MDIPNCGAFDESSVCLKTALSGHQPWKFFWHCVTTSRMLQLYKTEVGVLTEQIEIKIRLEGLEIRIIDDLFLFIEY